MFLLLRIILDVIFIPASYILAYAVKFHDFSLHGMISFPFSTYKEYLVTITLIYLLSLYLWGMYKTRKGFLIEIDALVEGLIAIVLAWAVVIVLTFIKGEFIYSRPIIILSLPISLLIILLYRQILIRMELWARSKGYGGKRAIVVGKGDLAGSVAEKIRRNPSYGVYFIGFIGSGRQDDLGKLKDFEEIIEKNKINAVYIADQSIDRNKLAELADICDKKNVSLGTLPDVFQILSTSPSMQDIDGMPIVNLKQVQLTPFNRFVKRTFDLVLALFGLVIFSIPMMIIAILVKLTSPGPAIYVQKRIGMESKSFRLYKFRTMNDRAEKGIGAVFATEDDPRKTSFGKFLRSTNLDELPQLFNIIKGDMSFVGPRPERPKFVSKFKEIIPNYMERHKINVGLAGWAQMQQGGYDMPPEEKLKYDLYYIENWSPILDIKILLKCAEIAFTRKRMN